MVSCDGTDCQPNWLILLDKRSSIKQMKKEDVGPVNSLGGQFDDIKVKLSCIYKAGVSVRTTGSIL